jgi:biopolymer transport protein TolQ
MWENKMLTQKILAVAQAGDEAILWILIALSILSVATMIERFFFIQRIMAKTRRIHNRIQIALQTYTLEDVEEISKDITTMEGRILSYGLKHIKEHGTKGLEELFNALTAMEKPKIERNLSFLATVGSTAPYIGLLGTVLGIMRAFHDLANAQEAGQQTVMAGISTALVATAIGLFVAIPAVVAFNYFQKKVKLILQNLDGVKELCLAYAKAKGN